MFNKVNALDVRNLSLLISCNFLLFLGLKMNAPQYNFPQQYTNTFSVLFLNLEKNCSKFYL